MTDQTIQAYTSMFQNALKRKKIKDVDHKINQFQSKLQDMVHADIYPIHNQYPSSDVDKIYAVIAMCLVLKDSYSKEETIEIVNLAFWKPKMFFQILTKIIDRLPNAYKIAEKWNQKDHEKRENDKSIIYDFFEVKEGRIEYKISKCIYVDIFTYYGIKEYCKIFCMTDTQAYENLKRHIHFKRYSDLSDGCCCHDVITRK